MLESFPSAHTVRRGHTSFRLLFAATLAAALGCGLMAGFFFAFSYTDMDALARLPPEQGIAAMQVIIVAVLSPWFRVAYFGTAFVCVVLAASSLFRRNDPGAAYLLVGCLFYLVGTILVTILFDVPRFNALVAVNPISAETASFWADNLTTWTAWNPMRTATALTAAALLTISLCRGHLRPRR